LKINLLISGALVFFCLSSFTVAEVGFGSLPNGWRTITKQIDPFDNSKVKITQASKMGFTFRCNSISMEVDSYGFESLSFSANIQYKVDENEPVKRRGKYSTYLNGSDMVTDDRYYSFQLKPEDISSFKAGNKLKMSGTYSTTGWNTRELDLSGFTTMFERMCE